MMKPIAKDTARVFPQPVKLEAAESPLDCEGVCLLMSAFWRAGLRLSRRSELSILRAIIHPAPGWPLLDRIGLTGIGERPPVTPA
jgi:hypothetical protein